MYKIKAPSEEYDRKIGGVQFVNGEAQTDNECFIKSNIMITLGTAHSFHCSIIKIRMIDLFQF